LVFASPESSFQPVPDLEIHFIKLFGGIRFARPELQKRKERVRLAG
jgi:hypothetical protein